MGNPYQGRHAPTGLAENFTWAVARVVMAEMPDDGLTCAWGLAMRISPWWRWNRLPSSRPESSASAGPPSDRAGGGPPSFPTVPVHAARQGRPSRWFCCPLRRGGGSRHGDRSSRDTQELVSNLDQADASVGNFGGDHAQAFTTSSNGPGYKLTSIDVEFSVLWKLGPQ